MDPGFLLQINLPATNAYIAFSFISVALLLAPVAWHFKHNNAGAACLGFWILLGNLTHGISSLVWRDDALDKAPAWCEISSKIILVFSPACLFAALGIARFIAKAVSPGAQQLTARAMRRMNWETYALSFGVPIAMMATHILYQPNRYAIVRTTGCQAPYVLSWPTFLLWLIWGPILAAVAALYAGYTCYRIWKGRREMQKLMASTGMPSSRFLRLVAMCCGYTAISLPLGVYYFVIAVRLENAGPWVAYNFNFIHSADNDHDFSAPTQVLGVKPTFNDCLALIGAVVYIAFFSFAKEALSVYAAIFEYIGLARFWPQRTAQSTSTQDRKVTAISLETTKQTRSETSLTREYPSYASATKMESGLGDQDLEGPPFYASDTRPSVIGKDGLLVDDHV